MRRYVQIVATIAAALLASSCETGRHSATGFRLPANGDATRGKAAFQELGCTGCHKVSGETGLPEPAPQAKVLVLGGERAFETSDGYLVTAIINPAYKRHAPIAMPSQADRMTIQQMTDLVAFLQTHYHRRPTTSNYGYY